MSFLLDTNVVSEWIKPLPNQGVIRWLAQADEDQIYLSVVTIGEIRYGVERLPASKRRARLGQWLRDELVVRFEGRVLPVGIEIAEERGKLVARRDAGGRPIHAMDALIAATAQLHALTLVTRNTADFEGTVQTIMNPWI